MNTGAVAVNVANPTTALDLLHNNTNNSFSNSCSFTINYLDISGGVPGINTNIVSGLFINKPPTTALAGNNSLVSTFHRVEPFHIIHEFL